MARLIAHTDTNDTVLCNHARTDSYVTVAGFACTIDVITWLDATFVYICIKTPEQSSLGRLAGSCNG
jgi:hypothetical protein